MAVCNAKCKNKSKRPIGTLPCGITPGFGEVGIGGAGGGFNGLGGQNTIGACKINDKKWLSSCSEA